MMIFARIRPNIQSLVNITVCARPNHFAISRCNELLPVVSLLRFNQSFSMSGNSKKHYDLVIYGATGFTGQFVVEEVAKVASIEQEKGYPIRWAIAGRNKEKLASILNFSSKSTDVGIIEASNEKPESLADMASKANVVINCVGPYHSFGEPVVKACIENGANHVDISGEPQFLEGMQLKYDESAEKAAVHIVGACGFDSIPADVGLCHMIKKFPGTLNSAECFVRIRGGKGSIHTGTMESAALAVANRQDASKIRRQLYPNRLQKPKFKKEKRGVLHKNPDLDRWCLPLPSDEPMVYRTQRYLHEKHGARFIQYQGFISFGSFLQATTILVGVLYFLTLCSFSWTRKLLLKFPEVMTAGVFSRKGPSREQLEKMAFTSTLIGIGWKDKLPENSDEYSTPPDSKIICKINGKDPGYAATSTMLVAAAMTILREKSLCEKRGGVMTPGIAFMNTNIIQRLCERGMTVSIETMEISQRKT